VHAAADVAIVPRALDGGVPVKLLDALARGVPVVAQRRALGGLALGGCASVCADDDADALAAALGAMLAAPIAAREVAQRGRAYVAAEHSAARFRSTLDDAIARATTRVTAGGR
jgi:glycosyltransferase involved in cell wall biosynthesis